MSESRLVVEAVPATTSVPRDLLARLYREIGISAVAAALQVDKPVPSTHIEASTPRLPKATGLAA